MSSSQLYTNESQDNQNDTSQDNLGFDNIRGNKKSNGEKNDGTFKLNLKLKERLFLFAFDLIEVNSIFNYVIYSIFVLIEFVFLAYYPLNQIYTDFVILKKTGMKQDSFKLSSNGTLIVNQTSYSKEVQQNIYSVLSTSYESLKGTGLYGESVAYEKRFLNESRDFQVAQFLSYLNIDYILDKMNYTDYISYAEFFCHVFIGVYFLYLLMVFSREQGTITLSGQRSLITKLFSVFIILVTKATQMPLVTFMLKIVACANDEVYFDRLQGAIDDAQKTFNAKNTDSQFAQINVPYTDYCYTGEHLKMVVYMTVVIFLYYSLVGFFHYFLTLSYPHEQVPWACLPTKVPILRELTKLFIIFSYQETNLSRYGISYLNIVYALLWAAIIYKRVKHVLIFHDSVYKLTIICESCMFTIFSFAALRDFVAIDRNYILHIIIVLSCGFASYTVILIREQVRLKYLSKVDFALYEKDFDALIMMFTLHELIERSTQDESQDFLLRGFIERHIEICEFTSCSCIRFYKVSNQNYRLELAQASPFSKLYDSNQINSNGGFQQQTTRMTTSMGMSMGTGKDASDGDELSTLKVFYGGSKKNQQKVNKKKQKFLKKFLIDNINVFLEIFPGSVKLHIMAAFIYFSIFKNSFKSLYELSFTKSKKSSLQDKYECFVLSSQVIDYFQKRATQGISNQPMQFEKAQSSKDEKKGKKVGEFNSASFEVDSDLKQVIEFEKINIQFQKMIEITSNRTRTFWEEILKKNIDVEKIFGLGAKIYKDFVLIKRLYKELIGLNNNYLEVAYLYKIFVSLILNFEIEVEDAKLEIIKIMQSKSMKKHNIKTEFKTIQNKEENGMIIISGCTGSFAKILAMNNKAERTFGYGTNELMQQRLNQLMPSLFADTHEELILNFINGNRKINKENHSFVWGKHKSGFIIPLIMEINAYVNFEFNFCFIALIKRSVLLEFKPLRDLLEYNDIFVIQASQNGIIQDMTQNMQEYLNFPLQALQKEISIEQIFRGIFDEELESSFQNGRKVEFDPQVIKRVLEQEDIDIRGDGDSDGGSAAVFNMSEKKCVALVWLRKFDYTEQEVKLQYREIWFVLTEDDANTFTETRNTTEFMTAQGDGEIVKQQVTYTDDREDICSIASMSSLSNYDKNRKNIMAKLSEIKTQTIDDQKPKQIDLLQKAIILVFLCVIAIAILLLGVSSNRNSGFLTNVDLIHQSKNSALYFAQLRLLLSTLIQYSNSRYNYTSDPILNPSLFPDEILDKAKIQIEELRKIQSYMNFVGFDYSERTLAKKKSFAQDFMQIRSNKIIESLAGNMSMIQGIKEYLDVANDVTSNQISGINDLKFDTTILNYDSSNSTQYQGSQIGQKAINYYQLLKNGHGQLGNYLLEMSEFYIDDAIFQVNQNSSLVLILTIVSIAITFLTALVILPILHKIERSKEKVLMIYTELKKEQIESLNRNIKVFFMKLQTGANQMQASLSYNATSKQLSNKLVTRKFTINAASIKQMGQDEDFTSALISRKASISQLDMGGGMEMLDGQYNIADPFSASKAQGVGASKFASTDPRKKGTFRGKTSFGSAKGVLSGHLSKNLSSQSGVGDSFKPSSNFSKPSENQSDDEEQKNDLQNEQEAEEIMQEGENAEEDKRARMLMSKEEAENAMFKRLFQNKIRDMTCGRQVKYYTLVAFISLLMSGYFTLSYFMVTNIFKDTKSSLELFDVVANRGIYLDSLMSTFSQAQIRQKELYMFTLEQDVPTQLQNAIDYYLNLTQTNENQYGQLRTQITSNKIIQGSQTLIEGLESQKMCEFLIDDKFVKEANGDINRTSGAQILDKKVYVDECSNYSNKLLQLGLQQTINTILQNIIQGTLQFRFGIASGNITKALLKLDKEQNLYMIIMVKLKYLNNLDHDLITSFAKSIKTFFGNQQSNYILVFAIFISIMLILMILLSHYGVEYLFQNLIAIKFILNFIPGQWLIENNAAEDLKYVEF